MVVGSVGLYVCLSVCFSICLSVCIYVCWLVGWFICYSAKRANVNKSYFYHTAINTEIFSHCQFMTIIYVPQGTNSSTNNTEKKLNKIFIWLKIKNKKKTKYIFNTNYFILVHIRLQYSLVQQHFINDYCLILL